MQIRRLTEDDHVALVVVRLPAFGSTGLGLVVRRP